MPVIKLKMLINAPIERVFDLSRSIDLHLESTSDTGEQVVGGRKSGLLEMGEEVVWQATHLGIKQKLGSRITQSERPFHFRDSMTRGAFKRFDHDHLFLTTELGQTEMQDVFDFNSPLGPLGWLVDGLFLKSYLARFLQKRNDHIRFIAEGQLWEKFLP